jgi:hypothetical protein
MTRLIPLPFYLRSHCRILNLITRVGDLFSQRVHSLPAFFAAGLIALLGEGK